MTTTKTDFSFGRTALALFCAASVVACATSEDQGPAAATPDAAVTTDSSTTPDVATDGAPTSDSAVATDSGGLPGDVSVPADAESCVYPKTETRACGYCGTQSRFCLPDGVYTGWTDCVGELGGAECMVGEKRTNDCGNCGKVVDFCDVKTCTWITGLCAFEGPCAPGDVETTKASCSVSGEVRTRTCNDKCEWGSFGACDLPKGWLPMASAPITGRGFHSAVWTGAEMIVWGGSQSSTYRNDGASYNLASNTWKTLPSAGLSARRAHVGVWTGSKMIVWGGYDGGVFKDGAIYDPSTNTWAPTATSPLTGRHTVAAAWSTTTNELLVWGGCTSGYCTAVAADGAAYDPATNTWSMLPAAPISARTDTAYAWTGTELTIWGGRNGGSTFYVDGARFDPAKRSWTKFSEPPSTVLDGRMDQAFAATDSGGLVIWGGRKATSGGADARANGAVYQPMIGFLPISAAPDTVMSPSSKRYSLASWVGGGKLYLFSGLDSTGGDTPSVGFASYDLATDTWTTLDSTGAPGKRARATAVWTGREAILFGGINGNTCCTGYADGAIYRP